MSDLSCFRDDILNPDRYTVQVGKHRTFSTDATEETALVGQIFRHPQYISVTHGYDVALLWLPSRLEFRDEVSPVCLPSTPAVPNRLCVASGWGTGRFELGS